MLLLFESTFRCGLRQDIPLLCRTRRTAAVSVCFSNLLLLLKYHDACLWSVLFRFLNGIMVLHVQHRLWYNICAALCFSNGRGIRTSAFDVMPFYNARFRTSKTPFSVRCGTYVCRPETGPDFRPKQRSVLDEILGAQD